MQHRTKRELRSCRETTHGSGPLGEDPLLETREHWRAHDPALVLGVLVLQHILTVGDLLLVGDALELQRGDQTPHLDGLEHVVVLVHIDRLKAFPEGELHGRVLVLGLTLPDDDTTIGEGVLGLPDSVDLLNSLGGVHGTGSDEDAILLSTHGKLLGVNVR